MQKLNLPHISLGQNARYANSTLTTQIINQHNVQNNGMSQSNQFLINNSNNVIDPEHLLSQNLRTDNFSSRAKSSDGGRFAESKTHSKNKIRMYGSKKILVAYTTYIKQSDHISKPLGESDSKIGKHNNKLINFQRPSITIHQSIRKKVIGSRKNVSPSISYISGPGNEDKMKIFKHNKQLSKSPSLTLKESLKRESLRPKVIGRYTKISAQIDLIGDLSEIKTLRDKKQDMYHEDELDIGKLGENQQKYLRNDQGHLQQKQKGPMEKKEENIFTNQIIQKKIESEAKEISESKQLTESIKIQGTYSKFLQNNKKSSVILTPTKKIRAQIDQIEQVKNGQDSSNNSGEKIPVKIYNYIKNTNNAYIECINQSSKQSDELLLSTRFLKESSIRQKKEHQKRKQQGASTNSICREQLDTLEKQIVSQEIKDQGRNMRSDKKISMRIGAKKTLKAVTDELKQEAHQETNKDQLSNIDNKSETNRKFLQKNKKDEKKPSVIVTSNKNIRAYQQYIECQKEKMDRIKSQTSIKKAEQIRNIRQEIDRILPKEQNNKKIISQQKRTNSSNKTLTIVSSNKNINAYIQQIIEPTYHRQDKIKESLGSQKSSQSSQFKNIQVIFQGPSQIQKDDNIQLDLDKNVREDQKNNFILQVQKFDKDKERPTNENQKINNKEQQVPSANISRKNTLQNEQKYEYLQSNHQTPNQIQEFSTSQKKITNFENKKQNKQSSLTNEYNSTKEDTILKEEKQSASKKTCSQQSVLNSPIEMLTRTDAVDVQKAVSLKQTIIDEKREEESQIERQVNEEKKQIPKNNQISQVNFQLEEKNNCMDKSIINENKFFVGQKEIEQNNILIEEPQKSTKTNEINRKSRPQSKQDVVNIKASYLQKQILPKDPKEKISEIQKLQQKQLKNQPTVRNNCPKQNLDNQKKEQLNDSFSPTSLIKRQSQIQLLSLTMNNQQIKPIPNKLKLEDSKNSDSKISGNSNKDLSQRSQINLSQKGSLKGLVRVSPRHHLKNSKLQKVSDSKKSLQQLDTLQFQQKSNTKSKDKIIVQSLSKRPQKKKLNITNHNGQTNLVKKIGLLKFKENQEQVGVGVGIGRQFSLMNIKRDKQNIRNAAYQDEYQTNEKSRGHVNYKSELKNKKNQDVLKNPKIPSPYLDPAFNSIKIKNTIYDKKLNEYEKKLISYPDGDGEWSKRQYQEKKQDGNKEQGFSWKSKVKKNHESSASKDNKIKSPFNQRQIEKLKEEYQKIMKKQEESSEKVRSNIRHQTQKLKNKQQQQEEEYLNRRNAQRHEGHTKSFKFLKAHSHQFSYLYPTKQLEETEGKLNKKLKQLDKKLKRCSYNLNKNHDEVHEYISQARRQVRESEKYLAEFN